MSQPGDLLPTQGSAGPQRAMAPLLQHGAAAFVTRLSTASSGNRLAASIKSGLRCQPGQPYAEPKRGQTLTLELDHLSDPGHNVSSKVQKL